MAPSSPDRGGVHRLHITAAAQHMLRLGSLASSRCSATVGPTFTSCVQTAPRTAANQPGIDGGQRCSWRPLLCVVQFDDEEDEELAAAVALPWWRRWFWLLALVLPLALSALVLAAGIAVRVLYPQPVRRALYLIFTLTQVLA